MLQYIIIATVSFFALFSFAISYKYLKETSQTTTISILQLLMLTIMLTLLLSMIFFVFLDLNEIPRKLFIYQSNYITISMTLFNISFYFIIPYIYFYLLADEKSYSDKEETLSSDNCK